MESSEESRRTKQFERLYTAVLLLLVAVLLLVSIFYTAQLWWVKVSIAVVLVSTGAFFGRKYLQDR
jgi:membrane protein YdbS with pleckstrin-like domain